MSYLTSDETASQTGERKEGNMTLKKSRHKYKNGENIQEGDKVIAYGSGVYREKGEECYISFEDNQWLVESPSAKMGYFLRDVLKNGYLEKIKPSNNKHFREYYELGCLCILTSRIKKMEGGDDAAAVEFYEENCQCSRHTNSANRECWDSLLTPEERKGLLETTRHTLILGASGSGKTAFPKSVVKHIKK